MSAALLIIAATIAGVLGLGLLARRGKDMDLEAVVRRRPRVRHNPGLRPDGRRDLYDVHVPRRQRLRLRSRRAGFLHLVLWLLGLRAVLLAAARRSGANARTHRLISQPDFFAHKYKQPGIGHPGRDRRHRGADPVPGAATQGPRHHRRRGGVRRDLPARGDLDWRGRRYRLCQWCPACTVRPGRLWPRTR